MNFPDTCQARHYEEWFANTYANALLGRAARDFDSTSRPTRGPWKASTPADVAAMLAAWKERAA